MGDGDVPALFAGGKRFVLAVVAVAVGVGEDHDAVGGKRGQRVVDGLRRLGFSHLAGRVDAFLLQALDRVLLGGLRLGDRVVGVGDPERDLGLVRGR